MSKDMTQEELLEELEPILRSKKQFPYRAKKIQQIYDQLKEIVREHFGLKNWTCTFREYYALPEPIRNYIAALETNADPPSMVRENIYFKETAKALERKNELLMQTIEAQQKPTVTDGDIECVLHALAINHWARKKILSQWLKEIGVEVEK